MTTVSIIGGGPRGLATALYARYKGFTVNLIDPNPLHTWSQLYMIPDIEMRSPVSFDLVTFTPELNQYSLSTFLGVDTNPFTTQIAVESSQVKVTREEFCNYLNFILSTLLPQINLIPDSVKRIKNNTILLSKGKNITSDAVIFATGFRGTPNLPHYLINTSLSTKVLHLPALLLNPQVYKSKRFLVLGSGQGAAEIVNYISKFSTNSVYWGIDKNIKVYQYPVPDYRLWGTKTALGNYYRTLSDINLKQQYLAKVKKWQPSITPYISSLLKQQSNYQQVRINKYEDLESLDFDYLVVATGVLPSITSLPTETFIPTDRYFPLFPEISDHFKINVPNTNWYVTGLLATAFDGPRQNSLVSAAITAKEIIENIDNVT